MKKFRYILLLLAVSMVWGCQKFDEDVDIDVDESSGSTSSSIVEVLEDGRLRVTAQLEGMSMTSVVTRATADENRIYDGWCLVFGEDEDNFNHVADDGVCDDLDVGTGTGDYSDDSPLIQIEPVTINANGTFTMVFDEYPNAAFIRIVVNLTDREDNTLTDIVSWRKIVNNTENGYDATAFNTPPTADQVSEYGIATFGQYRYQSVGLDGIYDVTYKTVADIETVDKYEDLTGEYTTWAVVYSTDGGTEPAVYDLHGQEETYNTNQPDPASPKTTGFPMSSYGFVMDEITETSLQKMFGSIVYMIRVCSKVQVEVEDSGFTMDSVYLINAAQESRIRSTVMSSVVTDDEGNTESESTSFNIPVDLGGTINYLGQGAIGVSDNSNPLSDPIYFYPNSGGEYDYGDGAVNHDINPQYVIIKGQADGYDTPGYYKVALKAMYPLDDTYTTYSDLTYDILRNTSFTVKLIGIDKPGYKTYADAANENSPANNISYSIEIETTDNRYEVLVSKGTYFTELETSRVYVKGYVDDGIKGCYIDFTMTPSEGNTTPSVYVQSSDYSGDSTIDTMVYITGCDVWYADADGNFADDASDTFGRITNTTGDGLADELVHITRSENKTKVRLYFDVEGSGRIRLRIGDILKFIPVLYDPAPVSMYGTKNQDELGTGLVVEDSSIGRSWSDFSYSDIVTYDRTDYEGATDSNGDPMTSGDGLADFELKSDGTITHTTVGYYNYKPELRARIFPSDAGDGVAVLYVRQASDFILMGNGGEDIIDDDTASDSGTATNYSVEYTAQSKVYNNDTDGLFSTVTNSDDTQYIEFSTLSGGVSSESVDAVTITTSNEDITVDNSGNYLNQDQYWNEQILDNGQTIQLSATAITYDLNVTYTEFSDDFIQYDNKAKTKIKVTNAAGD